MRRIPEHEKTQLPQKPKPLYKNCVTMESLSPLKSYLGLMRRIPEHEKTQLPQKPKPLYKNCVTPTRYERERAAMKNKPRKVLNLEERVIAIRSYHENPVYQRVASICKCSWEQIRNVIANRDDILRYYGECQTVTPKDSPQYARNKKINFLGNVTYEFVKRAYYHQSAILNDEVVQQRATKVRDILQISQFHPNKAWIADFKKVYNIDWNNLDALIILGKPPYSLDIKDLIDYCARMVAKAVSLIGEVPKQLAHKEVRHDVFDANADDDDDDDDDGDGDVYCEEASVGGIFGGTYGDNESDSMLVDNYDNVPVVNEIDDFAAMYQNNNTTRNYDEDQTLNDDEAESIVPHNYVDDNRTSNFNTTKSSACRTTVQHETTLASKSSTTQSLGDVQIKQEQRSRSNSPTLLSPVNMNSSMSGNCGANGGTNVKRQKMDGMIATPVELKSSGALRDPINTYADAIRALSPLEDFAIQEEDFTAINLLTQLGHLFERCAKRKPERKNI
ncbi:uncharacterized protein [Eurosta solidaginis]|uniref:uncharacterized protein isoform X2 n=1 Tax=Eurosta solidaginis TaxID=178769 RepID=UPI003530792C